MKILIADDNASEREPLGALAAFLGHEVVVCGDGTEVITAVAWFWPDLIILDVEMPGMDGISAARRLGELYPTARWRLVAYTGQRSLAQREATIAAGFTEHFCKPDDLAKIERLMKDGARVGTAS